VRFLNANDVVASVLNDSLSYNESAQFTATGSNIISWSWDFGDGTASSSQHAEHLYQQEGLYEVTLLTKNANQCSTRKTLYVYQAPHLFIPNVFTPNADGKNDQFVILYNGREPYHLVIVNRWGKEMFSSNDRSNYWNGTDGENGVYFYRLQTGKTLYKGWVHLLR
jgi:gliding motility-associated-like protein